MTISVTGPDGSTFNFPDETSQEIIKGALSKHYGASKPKQEPVGFFEALGRGAASGATLGFDNEAIGLVDEEAAAKYKARSEQSRKERPVVDFLGNVIGGVAAPIVATALLPEAATLAGAGLLAKGASLVPKAIQASRAARLAGRVAGSGLIGGGYGAAAGAGGAEEGKRLEGAKEGFLPGVAFGGAGKLVTEGAGAAYRGVRRLIEPMTKAGQKNLAAREAQEMFQGKPPVTVDPNIPGFKPMVGDEESIASAKLINPKMVDDRLSENKAAADEATQRLAGTTSSSEPILAGNRKVVAIEQAATKANIKNEEDYAAALLREKELTVKANEAHVAGRVYDVEQAEKEAANIRSARKKYAFDMSESAKKELGNITPATYEQSTNNKIEHSIKARGVLDNLYFNDKKAEKAAWDLTKSETHLLNMNEDKLKKGIKAFKKSSAVGIKGNEILKPYLSSMEDLASKTATLADLQNFKSDLSEAARSAMRGAEASPKEARLFNLLSNEADEIFQRSHGITDKSVLPRWQAAREATKAVHEKWDDPILGNVLEERAGISGAPSSTLTSLLTIPGRVDKLKSLITDPTGKINPEIISNAQNFLANDLLEKLKGNFANKNAVDAWRKQYSYALKQIPELGETFKNPEKALITAAKAKEFAKEAVATREIQALGKALEPNALGIQKPVTVEAQLPAGSEYLPSVEAALYDPKIINKKMEMVLRDNRPESMTNFLNVVGDSPEAINGTKRILGDLILSDKAPHEFIENNFDKISKVFSSKQEQENLRNIQEAYRQTALMKSTKKLAPPEQSILSALTKPAFVAATRPAIGIWGAVSLQHILGSLFNITSKNSKKLIIEGLLDPTGEAGKVLTQPIKKYGTDGLKKAYNFVMPGIMASDLVQPEPVQKKAAGGPVYTHPTISSIRAKRAMRSFAR